MAEGMSDSELAASTIADTVHTQAEAEVAVAAIEAQADIAQTQLIHERATAEAEANAAIQVLAARLQALEDRLGPLVDATMTLEDAVDTAGEQAEQAIAQSDALKDEVQSLIDAEHEQPAEIAVEPSSPKKAPAPVPLSRTTPRKTRHQQRQALRALKAK